ncbi:MAG: M50 family metallopeptidase [Armatimonadota bacterium]|nr:M50 family metallopeptidase [Armatimonadota bacterium]MDW8156283.1 M50 family metallopeptidase [Armatimonadota bacterium]
MSWLLAVVAFGLMILAHELGHFLVARWCGVGVQQFAVGFGPPLWRRRRGGTEYRLNVFPLGGYVRLAGEDAEEEAGPESFRSKGVWARIAIVAAGSAMNVVLSVLLVAVAAWAYGLPRRVTTVVAAVRPGWPAAEAGLRVGDRIVAIDGAPVPDGQTMVRTIHRSAGRPLRLVVERSGQRFEVTVTPRLDPRLGVGITGITPAVERERLPAHRALMWGAQHTVRSAREMVVGLVRLVGSGNVLEELAGPVGAVRLLGDAAQVGFDSYLFMTAFLSVMIGLFNLLPLPALDGGRLAFLLVEAVRRKAVDPRREGYVHLVGFALLLLLVLALTYRDILRWVGERNF